MTRSKLLFLQDCIVHFDVALPFRGDFLLLWKKRNDAFRNPFDFEGDSLSLLICSVSCVSVGRGLVELLFSLIFASILALLVRITRFISTFDWFLDIFRFLGSKERLDFI